MPRTFFTSLLLILPLGAEPLLPTTGPSTPALQRTSDTLASPTAKDTRRHANAGYSDRTAVPAPTPILELNSTHLWVAERLAADAAVDEEDISGSGLSGDDGGFDLTAAAAAAASSVHGSNTPSTFSAAADAAATTAHHSPALATTAPSSSFATATVVTAYAPDVHTAPSSKVRPTRKML